MDASTVANILKEGMMVGVKAGSAALWHGSILYEVEGNLIRIPYVEESMKDIEPGSPLYLKCSNDYFVYYFTGRVKAVDSGLSKSVLSELDNVEEIINTRLFPRYDVKLKADLRPVWSEEAYEATVTDISYGGAAFISEHKFESNENIEMILYLPDDVCVKVTGKVIRRRSTGSNKINHAAQFIECDNISNRQLSAYFSHLEDKAAKIYQQYLNEYKSEYAK